MSGPLTSRLPRGRSALPAEEVDRIQRARLCRAMAEVMAEKGYVATSVQNVLDHANVSRQTFYHLFDSKLDCFMAAFAGAGQLLLDHLGEKLGTGEQDRAGQGVAGEPLDRFEHAITVYLDALAAEFAFSRLFLVEVYAAGPEAIRRRTELQAMIADALADLLGVTGEEGRFSCRVIVAATSAMVTPLILDNEADGLRAIGPPMVHHVRRLWNSGAFDN